MTARRLVLCNGVDLADDTPESRDRTRIALANRGPAKNVTVSLEDLVQAFHYKITPRLVDLLELAAFIYAADTASARADGVWTGNGPEPWDRDFRIVMPVRDLAFWQRPDVDEALRQALDFVSGDTFTFDFRPYEMTDNVQEMLDFGPEQQGKFTGVSRVIMFSGGLDSLAGAVETAAAGESLVLVSHRSITIIDKRQSRLYDALKGAFQVPMIRIPAWVHKEEALTEEASQRTRSFLFCTLGAVVAEALGAGGVRFFENGVVSLNLGVSDEVLRARASRTTHPLTLHRFAAFFSLLAGRDLVIDNPYLNKTKSDVVQVLATHGHPELIGLSVSCATTRFRSASQPHCGACSQCIDRRIALIDAGLAMYEEDAEYESDVFTGPRKKGYEQGMAVNYVRHAHDLADMDDRAFLGRYSTELGRATRHHPDRRTLAAELTEVFLRHGRLVRQVITSQLAGNANALATGSLDDTCMLKLIVNKEHLREDWRRLAGRIVEILAQALPIANKDKRPDTEPELQIQCDALLHAGGIELPREFPYMRWGVVMTKPDWSSDAYDLLVELKYPRKRGDVRTIGKDIAEDIEKYGYSGKNVLFVVYDPNRCISNDALFAEPVLRRSNMDLVIVR